MFKNHYLIHYNYNRLRRQYLRPIFIKINRNVHLLPVQIIYYTIDHYNRYRLIDLDLNGQN